MYVMEVHIHHIVYGRHSTKMDYFVHSRNWETGQKLLTKT